MNFIEKSLKYKQVTLSVVALLFAFGVYSLLKMPRREDPKISIPAALVVAYYPGATSQQVEEQVTNHLEECLFKFEEVNKSKTTSASQAGVAVVTVEVYSDAIDHDMFWNKLRHELLILKQQTLPDGVVGPIVNSEYGDTKSIILGISGDGMPYDQLRVYAKQLEDMLRSIPSVSKIKREGEQVEQIDVAFSASRLAQYGLDVADVMRIVRSQNDIYPGGDIEAADRDLLLHVSGRYRSLAELQEQVVGTSRTGSVVKLKDIAEITRSYAQPTQIIKVGRDNAVMVSVEAQPGKNIVDFGRDVDRKLAEFRSRIPTAVHVTSISNQPEIVDHNITHFIQEFFIAIVAVILIIILMLPLRIALVAATAIPMTVALTLGIMNAAGIELQQVSLAALITVLGLVVDDAIVVADNYVELLDNGQSRWDAAWKSASELVVPILVATLTIIFSFMPMVMLTGSVGDFIHSLPITVSVALGSSFVVAMLFTPLLCLAFVKNGVHTALPGGKKSSAGFLDKMQRAYNRSLDWCIAHKKATVAIGLVPILLAGLIYKLAIKQKFFPSAERNQFVVELWMPTGTPLAATERAASRLADLVDGDDRVVDYNTFVGTSAPRFYYNMSPEFPVSNFAQILVNTTTNATTLELAAELMAKVDDAVPDGRCKVRLMQQGKPLKADVEVRIQGEEIAQLRRLGEQVKEILRSTAATAHVQDDFREDCYSLDVKLTPQAQRLGFTTEAVALSLYAGFAGAPVTYVREGDNNVRVLMRLAEEQRQSVGDLQATYLTSPATGARVPLSQIAEVRPMWTPGRIMHRNGARTLTVESETDGTALASEILAKIRPQVAAMALPEGYAIDYGGEYENQSETFAEMIDVLLVGLLLIFLIILFQFRNVKETLLILLTIPMSVFGAIFGLMVTGNNFGFTAFVGLICLSGIVVRNSIILIDHIHELVDKQGMDLARATVESGKRRMRPIFLTAMAAAFGVIPMILSGSSLWSPLASCIAFGVVWSMVVALLLVPVIYLMWIVPKSGSVSK